MEFSDNNVKEDNQVKRGTYSLFEDMCSEIGVKHPSDLRICHMTIPRITNAMLLEWLELLIFYSSAAVCHSSTLRPPGQMNLTI